MRPIRSLSFVKSRVDLKLIPLIGAHFHRFQIKICKFSVLRIHGFNIDHAITLVIEVSVSPKKIKQIYQVKFNLTTLQATDLQLTRAVWKYYNHHPGILMQ